MKSAIYKGRRYRLLWSGETKFGLRAHLKFFDGSKDFWVAVAAITEVEQPKSGPRKNRGSWPRCDSCGYSGRELGGSDAICPRCGVLTDD